MNLSIFKSFATFVQFFLLALLLFSSFLNGVFIVQVSLEKVAGRRQILRGNMQALWCPLAVAALLLLAPSPK